MILVPSWSRLADHSSHQICSSSHIIQVRGSRHRVRASLEVLTGARTEGTTTTPIRWEGVTTPPIPSSSPYVPDNMDISPLPHKAPFSFITERLNLPTTDLEDDMVSPCEAAPPPQFPIHQLEIPRPVSAAE